VSLSPRNISKPNVVLTPYIILPITNILSLDKWEPLVEGRDLVVNNGKVYMKTTSGLQQVDVIYRRLDDEYLDPLVLNQIVGVPGLISAYKMGTVALQCCRKWRC
jgi:hypothetical protein